MAPSIPGQRLAGAVRTMCRGNLIANHQITLIILTSPPRVTATLQGAEQQAFCGSAYMWGILLGILAVSDEGMLGPCQSQASQSRCLGISSNKSQKQPVSRSSCRIQTRIPWSGNRAPHSIRSSLPALPSTRHGGTNTIVSSRQWLRSWLSLVTVTSRQTAIHSIFVMPEM